ncbi:MAG TPA: 4Fe-4S binding protein [Chloroflexi bacterium]|jgi:predicted aldo/keto reductase-like oxidoreductase|nr:4Fe-4S binding protein [Chloroflexota bacterium]
MEYRTLGRTGLEVSAISLGTEHLLDLPPDHVASVIHAALDHGINYFDLFWAHPEFRDMMGAAFKGHRHRALLAAHLGAAMEGNQYVRTRDKKLAEQYFHDFLTRYETDYVDVLFLHNCDTEEDLDTLMSPGGLMDMAQRYQLQGKTRYIGFSGHTASIAQEVATTGYVDVIMFPINLVGHAIPGRNEFMRACVTHNIGLVGMKPYAGGTLLRPDRTLSMEHWQSGGQDVELNKSVAITPVQCLSYSLEQPGVSTLVPGCRSLEELDAALAYFTATPEEKSFVHILKDFEHYTTGECVYCNHCLPCPAEIDIARVMRLLDSSKPVLGLEVAMEYRGLAANGSDCIKCGACEERCPFDVPVMERMDEVAGRIR